MIHKTRRRFMLLMATVTTLIIAAALVAIYIVTYSNLEAVNRGRLQAREELRVTDEGTVNLGQGTSDAVVVERITSDIGVGFSMLADSRGRVLAANSTIVELTDSDCQLAADIAWNGVNYGKIELFGRFWQYAVFRDDIDFELVGVQVPEMYEDISNIRFVDITESREMLGTLAITLTGIGLVLFLLFFLCSAYFSKRAIQPMVEGLEKQRQFVADASHELKTPVSIIKTNCSVLRANEEATIAEQIEWLDNIETGADRMKKLIQNLITLVKIEGTDSELILSQVELVKEIKESLSAFHPMIESKRLRVEEAYGAGTGLITSDADSVRQIINILLDNAIKYAEDGGATQVILTREKKWACLSVLNTGAGIEKENLDKVFDRFYRGESARSHDGSHGLGLSIAAEVMRRLGGTISVESVPNESTVFTVRFPV